MRRGLVCLLAALLAVVTWSVGAAPPAGAAGETWTARNAPPGDWNAVTYGTGRYVAVGDQQVMTSTDAVTWTPSADPDVGGSTWTSVTYGNGLFVAVALDTVITSTDGASWSVVSDGTDTDGAWTSVTYGNGVYVAVANGAAMTSTNGTDWTPVADADVTGIAWTSVAYGNGLYVAVAQDEVITSTNGTSWADATDGTDTDGAWTSVTYGNGLYVAVATDAVMTSTDASDWSPVTPPTGSWSAVVYAATQFVAVATGGTNHVMTSDDGATWTARTAATPNGWNGIAFGGGLVVAVGSDAVMTSDDGVLWTDRAAAATTGWRGITHGNGVFVAVAPGPNRVMTSGDGIVWIARPAPPGTWESVTFGNGTYVAVGSNGTVMTSPNGVVWTARTPAAANAWQSVTFGNGLFVAVSSNGASRVMTSPNGVTWTLRPDADANGGVWSSVTYGNGLYVAVGNGKAIRSTDGIAWDDIADTDVDGTSWNAVAYGDDRFVAVANGKAITSTDGTAWTAVSDTDVTGTDWTALTHGQGTWVAVGANAILTSTDGTAWTPRTSPTDSDWSAVAYGSGVFAAVADGGSSRVMTSGSWVAPPTITSFLPVFGLPGTAVRITGTNLSGASSVTIGGIEVTHFTVDSASQITAVVPADAETGAITVTTPGGTAISTDQFTVATSNRIFGPDAIDTSIAISKAEFPTAAPSVTASAVVLARSDFFSDALAGGPFAAKVNGPLLITPGTPMSTTLDPRVRTEIDRLLDPGQTVYILGGPLAISVDVDAALTSAGYRVQRIGGANLFSTAVAIANAMGAPSAILEATGNNFPDALSAVPAAIQAHGVILLTNDNVQAPETQAYITAHPSVPRYAIGGPLVAAGADPGATAVYGQDLYGTSAAVANRWFAGAPEFGVATGANFPDALSGGVFMATGGRMGPVVLVPPKLPLPNAVTTYLGGLAEGTPGYVFGGPLAVSDGVLAAVLAAVG